MPVANTGAGFIDPAIGVDDYERALVARYGFRVLTAGSAFKFEVRDPVTKKSRRGGNLRRLLVKAYEARLCYYFRG